MSLSVIADKHVLRGAKGWVPPAPTSAGGSVVLDCLAEYVNRYFSAIPNTNVTIPDFKHFGSPFDSAALSQFYYLVPVHDVTASLPPPLFCAAGMVFG
jgi:hypothetical protein